MEWVRREFKAASSGNGAHARPNDLPHSAARARDVDYTPAVLDFLQEVHGNIRRNAAGDYYYGDVSAISLHFLLRSRLPTKEVLWNWYQHFDQECSESIYQTVRPLQDEVFLYVLSKCDFRWDVDAVRSSGLVFNAFHRRQVFAAIEEQMCHRLDAFRTLVDDALRGVLTPTNTWSEVHLRRLVRNIQTRPIDPAARQALYERLGSDYVRATARHLMDEAATDLFWKALPPELEALPARFSAFTQAMLDAARRLGVFVSHEGYKRAGRPHGWEGQRRGTWRHGANPGRLWTYARSETAAAHYAILGLKPSATLPEVKIAYRNRVKQCHPDQGGTVQEFLQLQEAYEYLLTEVYA